jgi:tripeptidyl-peptidase-1
MLYPDQTILNAESVMHIDLSGSAVNFSSSGGFSNYFEAADYQAAAVEQYFDIAHIDYPYYSELEPDFATVKGLYNRVGRAYPDLASNGAYYPAYNDGTLYHFFGASLAAPTVGSILTLVRPIPPQPCFHGLIICH